MSRQQHYPDCSGCSGVTHKRVLFRRVTCPPRPILLVRARTVVIFSIVLATASAPRSRRRLWLDIQGQRLVATFCHLATDGPVCVTLTERRPSA
ncbi:hypothetical protein BJV78DRAFT_1286583 [Lactifluus subvellereus]|nr:hypothetical protein BJV78DRAFT_1286583 [Lactifluus subvellereus]